MTRLGGCLCGTVRYTIEGDIGGVSYCHCSQCRRQTGHYLASVGVPDSQIRIEGLDAVGWYAASESARRGFCRTCGSVLFWRPVEGGHYAVAAGSFDVPSGLAEENHIFVTDKGDYYEIDDGLPQFAQSSS